MNIYFVYFVWFLVFVSPIAFFIGLGLSIFSKINRKNGFLIMLGSITVFVVFLVIGILNYLFNLGDYWGK